MVVPSNEAHLPISRAELISECQLAALALASQIYSTGRGKCGEVAAAYLGVEFEDYELGWENDKERASIIPIKEYALYNSVMDAYDYAYQINSLGGRDPYEIYHEINAIHIGMPQADSSGMPSPLSPRGDWKLPKLAKTFFARVHLDYGEDLTITDLAHLTDMTEAAVRSSLSSEGIKTQKGRHAVVVDNENARIWLSKRRNFIPSIQNENGEHVIRQIERILATERFSFPEIFNQILEIRNISTKDLTKNDSISPLLVGALSAELTVSKIHIDIQSLIKIANELGIPIPKFVGRASEYLLEQTSIPSQYF